VNEHPILFSGPMVRAILAGTKTQTRRLVKPAPHAMCSHVEPFRGEGGGWIAGDNSGRIFQCPFGIPGDRLWVRETWAWSGDTDVHRKDRQKRGDVWWRADEKHNAPNVRWRPSIHMPRWASRLTLEVESVRVERLQDITEEDARAEGVELPPNDASAKYRPMFQLLWDSINSARATWASNPWVFVVGFRRLP
jgi:hypothetical protein